MTTQSAAEPLPPLIVIVGPTAVGKTDLSIRLAEAVGGEIISADSRQVYRGLDIGTAKATPEEQARVPHHLLDILDPDETLGAAEFQEMAYERIDDVLARGKVPFLVGGTGQYVMAVIEGWQIPRVPPQEKLRAELYTYAEQEGHEALHARLQALDPVAAKRIDARNVRRVVRALEVCLVSGRPISEQQRKAPPPYRILGLGLTRSREALYEQIDRRIDRMIGGGLVDEVRALVAAGYLFDLPAMSGLGYGQFEPYLAGEVTIEDVTAEIARQTRRFVRQQANWFRPGDPRFHWLDVTEDIYGDVLALVRDFLALPSVADPRPRFPASPLP
ncbi:MAG: tRNA (adenosine(37)-N6)-dimethylallyltransferase MiaA [Anaerolineae bacterium]|nr:tRNA (adenosine(37)-N6)-dimethylallyltransferase MiaA [Anaerolineae bacterium]